MNYEEAVIAASERGLSGREADDFIDEVYDPDAREFYLERERKIKTIMKKNNMTSEEAHSELIRREDAERLKVYEAEIAELMAENNCSRERAEMIYIPF